MRIIGAFCVGMVVSAVALFGQLTDMETVYTPSAERAFLRADESYTNGIGIVVTKGGYPVVNRSLLFVSLDTNVLVFENGASEMVFRTDDTGYASPPFRLLKDGKTSVIAKDLSRRSRSDVAFEARIEVNSCSVSLRVMRMTALLLFAVSVIIAVISYFTRLKKKTEKPTFARRMMSSLLGFSHAPDAKIALPIIALLECILMFFLFQPNTTIFFTVFVLLFTLSAFTIKGDRTYALYALSLATLGIVYALGKGQFSGIIGASGGAHRALYNPFIVLAVFLVFTMFMNGHFFPFLVLAIYAAALEPPVWTIIVALSAIFLATIVYVVTLRFKARTFIFYRLNFLKIKV